MNNARKALMAIWRIYDYIKLVLENLKDNRLKSSKVAIFISEYSIVLSLFLIIFGSYIIFSSFDRTLSNTVLMDLSLKIKGTFLYLLQIVFMELLISYEKHWSP